LLRKCSSVGEKNSPNWCDGQSTVNLTAKPAIVLSQVTKHFQKRARSAEYTTFKTELVKILTGKRKVLPRGGVIEALKGVDLTVSQGSTIGIIGRNGSGKSTLLKIITGIYSASSGLVKVNGRISALLELGAGFHPDFTGRENIFINGMIMGMTRAELKARVDEIIAFAELGDFIDEPVRTYSSGMFMRLAFAVATHVDPEILIIDEILSVGDEHFQKKSRAKMLEFKESGRTILLVTHDLGTVTSWCDSVAWIDGGVIRMTGNPQTVVTEYRRALEVAEQQVGNQTLSQPGLALPEVPVAAATSSVLSIEALELQGSSGALVSEAPAILGIVYSSARTAKGRITCRCLSASGGLVFETGVDVSCDSPAAARASLHFSRLSLAAGDYRMVVSIHAAEASCERTVDFTVKSPAAGSGVLSLDHQWKTASGEA
jgi:lipopolysaccharide transport system ATP-binding protein